MILIDEVLFLEAIDSLAQFKFIFNIAYVGKYKLQYYAPSLNASFFFASSIECAAPKCPSFSDRSLSFE